MPDIPKIPAPRTQAAAAELAERFAKLEGKIALIEQARNTAIADANAAADKLLDPLTPERNAIRDKLATWWGKHGVKLLDGTRKSIELGGCMIGSRTGKAKLAIAGDEKDVVDLLRALRWAKPFLKVKTTLDKVSLLKGTEGKRGPALAELGITRDEGEEIFFLERTEQGGTQA